MKTHAVLGRRGVLGVSRSRDGTVGDNNFQAGPAGKRGYDDGHTAPHATGGRAMTDRGVVARVARRVAASDLVPTAQRAVLGHYAETGTLDYRALGLKSRVDDAMEEILAALYGDVEAALCEAFGVDDAEFRYETKLTLPAELTLGYLFRQARSRAEGGYDPVADEPAGTGGWLSLPTPGGRPDGTAHRRRANRDAAALVRDAREMTAFVVAALLDGDMRDAINDDEFEDFVVNLEADVDRRRVATVAQSCLEERVAAGFAEYPDGVRAAYDHAVEVSEAHQAQDERFRALLAAAIRDDGDTDAGADARTDAGSTTRAGVGADASGNADVGEGDDDRPDVDGTGAELTPEAAREAIEAEYKHRPMADDDHPFTDAELDLPYLTTQYDRVGVIYHGMLEMYRHAGFEVEETFERSIVFTIVGAQVWLDDVDDYTDDVAEGQLTPVTAEYVLADSEREAFETVVDVAEAYFDRGRSYAEAADSTLTGLAVEYVLRSGDVEHLPGADS